MAKKKAAPKKKGSARKGFPKTKMFGKLRYSLKEQKSTKPMATKSANASRSKGKLARIVSEKGRTGGNTHGIYIRGKPRKK